METALILALLLQGTPDRTPELTGRLVSFIPDGPTSLLSFRTTGGTLKDRPLEALVYLQPESKSLYFEIPLTQQKPEAGMFVEVWLFADSRDRVEFVHYARDVRFFPKRAPVAAPPPLPAPSVAAPKPATPPPAPPPTPVAVAPKPAPAPAPPPPAPPVVAPKPAPAPPTPAPPVAAPKPVTPPPTPPPAPVAPAPKPAPAPPPPVPAVIVEAEEMELRGLAVKELGKAKAVYFAEPGGRAKKTVKLKKGKYDLHVFMQGSKAQHDTVLVKLAGREFRLGQEKWNTLAPGVLREKGSLEIEIPNEGDFELRIEFAESEVHVDRVVLAPAGRKDF